MVAKKPRVVIVGAGMAGLTAAHRLHTAAAGLFDLSVVEAGRRIGGRIHTSDFAGDRVEMGATWIHGIGGSPIYALARDHHLLTDPLRPWERMHGFPENPITITEDGVLVDPLTVVDPISTLYRRLMDDARSGDAAVTKENPSIAAYLRRGLQAYRAARGCGAAALGGGAGAAASGRWSLEELEDAVFAMNECEERTCTSVDDLSWIDLAAEREYREFPGHHITIGQGYSRVVEWFAAALPQGAVQFGRRLRRVEWRPDGGGSAAAPVSLHFDDGSVATADHVIVTVSLGVLKAGLRKDAGEGGSPVGVIFNPSLPAFKKEAIGRLGFGVVDKLFMELERDGGGGEQAPFPYLQMAFDQGTPPARQAAKIPRWIRRTAFIAPIYNGSRVLLAWLAGEEAMEMESKDEEEIIRGVHATLDGFLNPNPNPNPNPNSIAAPTGRRVGRVKRSGWGSDPLFLGSYSYVAVGSSGDDLDLMAEPLPRCGGGGGAPAAAPPLQILFAGEATHRTHYSTTHGAYFSGMREANRLLKQYRCVSG